MERIPFSQVLKNAKVDIHIEYERLYSLFYLQENQYGKGNTITLKDFCANCFLSIPFRGTCITLVDFDEFHGFHFEVAPRDFNIDYLVSFCEYSYNLVCYSDKCINNISTIDLCYATSFYIRQITDVIEKIGYMKNIQNGVTDFVPKDQAAISVAEIVDPNLSYRVIEYNHHSMKGDLERKKEILLAFAHNLEPQLKRIKQFNSSLEDNLSCLFNNLNLRHNNVDQNGGNNYKSFVANMKKEEIEHWYDTIYQMCLLAFLGLDYLDHKDKFEQLNQIEQLKQNIRPQKS